MAKRKKKKDPGISILTFLSSGSHPGCFVSELVCRAAVRAGCFCSHMWPALGAFSLLSHHLVKSPQSCSVRNWAVILKLAPAAFRNIASDDVFVRGAIC